MSRRKLTLFGKMVLPAFFAIGVVTLSTMNGCTPSNRSTETQEAAAKPDHKKTEIESNAMEAEAAEAQMAKNADVAPAAKPEEKKTAQTTHSRPHVPAKVESPGHDAKTLAKGELEANAAKAKNAQTKSSPTAGRKPASVGGGKVGGAFVVQVGAFKVKENAEKLHDKLKSSGYSVRMETVDGKNGTFHLVRFEPTSNRAEAETMIEDLHSKLDLQARVLKFKKH